MLRVGHAGDWEEGGVINSATLPSEAVLGHPEASVRHDEFWKSSYGLAVDESR